MVSEKDYQWLMNVIKEALERARHQTKEEAIQDLIDAGILDKNGKHAKPYRNLGRFIESQKQK